MNSLLLSITFTLSATAAHLKTLANKWGYKAPTSVFETIAKVSNKEKIDPVHMLKIAVIESKLKHSSIHFNKNKTIDVGLFQINTVNKTGICRNLNIYTLEGNTECAAKLIKGHKKFEQLDSLWLARYNSKTLINKITYYRKLSNLEE